MRAMYSLKKHSVVIDEKYVPAVEPVTYVNYLVIQTGVEFTMNSTMWIGTILIVLSAALMFRLIRKRRKMLQNSMKRYREDLMERLNQSSHRVFLLSTVLVPLKNRIGTDLLFKSVRIHMYSPESLLDISYEVSIYRISYPI